MGSAIAECYEKRRNRIFFIDVFVAPQAQLEESANDRGKPEVPFNWDVKRFGGLVFGP